MKCERGLQLTLEGRHAEARQHAGACVACQQTITEQARISELLEEWRPNVQASPSFDAKLRARIAAMEAEPADGWLARLLERWPSPSLRQLAATALLVVILLGAGMVLRQRWGSASSQNSTAVVGDLQTLDRDSELVESFDVLSESVGTVGAPSGTSATQNR